MLRIDTAQQFALVVAERDGVIALPCSGLPRWFLAGQDDRQPIEVGDDTAIDGLVEREQARLVREQLTDGDALLALLRELRPVRAHSFFVIEPASGVRECQGHRRQALGGRMDDHHGAPLPRLAVLLVADTAPDIDDLLAVNVGRAGAAELMPPGEVLGECLPDALEAGADVSLHRWCGRRHGDLACRMAFVAAVHSKGKCRASATYEARLTGCRPARSNTGKTKELQPTSERGDNSDRPLGTSPCGILLTRGGIFGSVTDGEEVIQRCSIA